MALEWLPSARRAPITGQPGFPWQVDCPPKIVIHTTEGGNTVPSYTPGLKAPHATVLPKPGIGVEVVQHIPLDRASYSLMHPAGVVPTNGAHTFQFELAGTSEKGGPGYYWPDADTPVLRDLYAKVIKPLADAYGVQLIAPQFKAYPASYGDNNGVRLSGQALLAWKGVLGHQHVPGNCVDSRAVILCSDLIWRPAGSLRIGDEIVAFDEETVRVGNANGGRKYRLATVTANQLAVKNCYRVTTEQGEIVASEDHPWLVHLPYVNRGSRIAWVRTSDLNPAKHKIYSIGRPWHREDSREAGWLAGVLDADGHAFAGGIHGSYIGFGQVDGAVLDKFVAAGKEREWDMSIIRRDWTQRRSISARPKDFTDVRVKGGLWENIRLLGTLQPERLFPMARKMWQGRVVGKTTGTVKVLSVEHVGDHEIASLSTSTHTYIAEGMLCHNTHGDPGAFPWARLLEIAHTPPITPPEDDVPLTPADIAAIAEASARAVHGQQIYRNTWTGADKQEHPLLFADALLQAARKQFPSADQVAAAVKAALTTIPAGTATLDAAAIDKVADAVLAKLGARLK